MTGPGGSWGQGEDFHSTYQGLGAFSSPDGGREPGKRRTWVVVGIVAALLLLGGGATAFFLTRDLNPQADDPPKPPPSTSTTTTSGTTSGTTTHKTTTTTPPTTEPSGPHIVDASVAGWRGVLSQREEFAYDVPKDWRVEAPEFVTGFRDDSGDLRLELHGVSTYRPEACPDAKGSIRGRAGFAESADDDPKTATKEAAVAWADSAIGLDAGSGKVNPSAPRSVPIADGKLSATVVTAEVKAPKGACSAPRIKVTAAAFSPSSGPTLVFVMYMDQGVDDELDDGITDTIVRSLRPHQAQP